MISSALQIISFLFYGYLVLSTLYLLILAVAGKLAKDFITPFTSEKKSIVVLIPAFKEDSIILETARKAISHNYPSNHFQVVVIADSLRAETILKLQTLPLKILEVKFDISTKAKSLYAALQYLRNNNYDIIVILDADNVMDNGCLEKINGAFHYNLRAAQCHRVAKNQDSATSILGAISEEININLFRRGPASLGLSAMPLGSGMAFDYPLFAEILEAEGILDNPAEDREIEIQLMKKNQKMEFLNDVFVFDEKASDPQTFKKQRIRWLEAQMNHFLRFFKPDMKKTLKSAVYYNIFLQSLLLPRLLYLVVSCVILLLWMVQGVFKISLFYPMYPYWLAWMAVYFLVLIISVPLKFYNRKTIGALAHIPVLMLSMAQAIFKLKRNRKEFLHTTKTYNDY